MARDIRITPKLNSTTTNDFPEIQFGGLSSSTIKLKVDDDGSVVYTGTYGVLFNVTDEKNGLLHSVNDISGLPILQVYSWDYVQMGKWDKYTLTVNSDKVGVGLTAPSTKFHIYSTQSGVFRLQDGSQGAGYVLQSDANGVGTWTSSSVNSGNQGYLAYYPSTGSIVDDTGNLFWSSPPSRLGIGTTGPNKLLHVAGEVEIDSIGNAPASTAIDRLDTLYTNTAATNVAMGTPDVWLKINVNGTDYVFPGYTFSAQ